MADVRRYLKISETARSVKEIYASPEIFSEIYKKVLQHEKRAVLHHFLLNNKPFGFDEVPLLMERIKEYLSEVLEVDNNNIRLIGSAKTGFSMGDDEYGRKFEFDGSRDLDFTIIDSVLFERFQTEYEKWVDYYQRDKISPKEAEKKKWQQNLATGKNQLHNHFFDIKYIPNRPQFPLKSSTAEALFQIKFKLEEYHDLKIKFASIRVYKTWNSFLKMLTHNTEMILKLR